MGFKQDYKIILTKKEFSPGLLRVWFDVVNKLSGVVEYSDEARIPSLSTTRSVVDTNTDGAALLEDGSVAPVYSSQDVMAIAMQDEVFSLLSSFVTLLPVDQQVDATAKLQSLVTKRYGNLIGQPYAPEGQSLKMKNQKFLNKKFIVDHIETQLENGWYLRRNVDLSNALKDSDLGE